jgi:nucleoside-triphosphatase THEP1
MKVYYSSEISKIINNKEKILNELSTNSDFDVTGLQYQAWQQELDLLEKTLFDKSGHILLEVVIPRLGKRIDSVLFIDGKLLLLEFKGGDSTFENQALTQLLDYALDLKNFHEGSYKLDIIPILVDIKTDKKSIVYEKFDDGIYMPSILGASTFKEGLEEILKNTKSSNININDWINSSYRPTPNIIEAAQSMYLFHDVKNITYSEAGKTNLDKTTNTVNDIIDLSVKNKTKSIIFVTGVPGSGKTLAGLNIANSRQSYDNKQHAVFLSGNGPLVEVLQEALARDESKRMKIPKSQSERKVKMFIQNVHNFRDEAIINLKPLAEKIVIFDEAQRAWDQEQTVKFMKNKKRIEFSKSEPEFLIEVLNRNIDYAVIICLVGNGQEIHKGEAGINEWLRALNNFPEWKVFLSDQFLDFEKNSEELNKLKNKNRVIIKQELHLSIPLRSFRSEKTANFANALLSGEFNIANKIYRELKEKYPILMTRDLNKAKEWIKKISRGSERYGMLALSNTDRLRPYGIWTAKKIEPKNWFLNDKFDIRSSFYLEETATEFDVQGLELDYSIIAWDQKIMFDGTKWIYQKFNYREWSLESEETKINYLVNSMRVLLTRSRQGYVLFLPKKIENDLTSDKDLIENTYKLLKQIGIEEI